MTVIFVFELVKVVLYLHKFLLLICGHIVLIKIIHSIFNEPFPELVQSDAGFITLPSGNSHDLYMSPAKRTAYLHLDCNVAHNSFPITLRSTK